MVREQRLFLEIGWRGEVLRAVIRAPKKVFYGWWIVLAAATMNVYGAGVWFYGFPVFFPKILAEFGWSRALTAGAFSLSRVEGGLEAPIIGYLVDRYGPRRLAMVGATVAGIGFITMSQINSVSIGSFQISALIVFYMVFAGLISVGYNTGFSHAAQPAIANWFIKKRSRAFAFWSLGAGFSGATVATLGWLIETIGWRSSAFWVGIGMFVFILPLAMVLRRKPEDYGQYPDGIKPDDTQDVGVATAAVSAPSSNGASHDTLHDRPRSGAKIEFPEYDFTVRQALATSGFWFLLLGSATRSVAMTSVVIHQVAYLEDVGFSFDVAKNVAAGTVFFSLIGRFSFGWLGDYFDKRHILIVSIALQVLGLIILDGVKNMTQIWAYVAVYSIGYGGAIPVWTAMRGEYFGRKYFATIGGIIQFLLMPAAVLGPIFAGLIFDLTKSYHWAFVSFIFSLMLSMVFIYFARRPKPPTSLEQQVHQPELQEQRTAP